MSSNAASQKHPGSPAPFQFVQSVGKIAGGTILGISMLASSAIAGGLVGLAVSFRNLPDVRSLQGYVPNETSHIYDIKGKLLASVHDEANREVVPLNEISPQLKRAILAIEDSNFYHHQGVNPIGIARASIVNFRRGRTVEGGSTLTMQLVKNLFLSPERTLNRKVTEAVLALRLEQIFNKDQILEMYLNQVYWGHNTYGVETAAASYFDKPAAKLTLGESAMMAGIVQAPEVYSPFINYNLAKQRQELVLNRLAALRWITPAEAEAARNQPIKLGKITSFQRSRAPYVTNGVVQELNKRFGREAVLKGEMRVQTSIDFRLQQIAQATVQRGHANLINSGVHADQ
ncbi:MAG TPA: transglycosylase domain-containing protein, partial [Candidatus Caenarcaniphilales bacterium]